MERMMVLQSITMQLEWMSNQEMEGSEEYTKLKEEGQQLYNLLEPYQQAQFKLWGSKLTYSEYLLEPYSRWHHPESDSTYTVIGIGRCSTNGPEENKTRYAIYWSDTMKEYKVRKLEEFLDGRFIPLGADGFPLAVYDDGSGVLWKVPQNHPVGGGASLGESTTTQQENGGKAGPKPTPVVCHFQPSVDTGEDEPPDSSPGDPGHAPC